MELPREERLRWILRASARLLGGGAEPVSGVVLPNEESFPDHFDGSRRAVAQLLSRTVHLAGLDEVHIELDLSAPGEEASCSTGGCCSTPTAAKLQRVRRGPEGYIVSVAPQELGNPTLLTTLLARSVTGVFLAEASLLDEFAPPEREAALDVAAVMLGFGVLLANGSYIYSKGCGGVKVSSATHLPPEELAVALAVFMELHSVPARPARQLLEPNPRGFFDEATRWVGSNAGVVGLVRSDRAAIEADSYALGEARGWFSRLFGLGRARGPSVPSDDDLEKVAKSVAGARPRQPIDPERQKRRDEIRALVDESLDS